MKVEKFLNLIIILLVFGAVLSSFYFYQFLPEQVITHWNWQGQADGWSSKNFQVIFFPALIIFMWLLLKFLPRLDPRVKNYKDFNLPYLVIQLSLILFLSLVYTMTNLVNMGHQISISWTIMTMMGIMFGIFGFYMPKLKPNWFVGIRTPWTLSSDVVWTKTHQYGGKVFMAAGLIFIILPYAPDIFSIYGFILAIAIVLSSLVYSYFVHRKL